MKRTKIERSARCKGSKFATEGPRASIGHATSGAPRIPVVPNSATAIPRERTRDLNYVTEQSADSFYTYCQIERFAPNYEVVSRESAPTVSCWRHDYITISITAEFISADFDTGNNVKISLRYRLSMRILLRKSDKPIKGFLVVINFYPILELQADDTTFFGIFN